jgi:hypothetical protein
VAWTNLGTNAEPIPNYRFRLKLMTAGSGSFLTAGANLTAGINETVNWWSPDIAVSYTGELWELSPVEVRVRSCAAEPGRTNAWRPRATGLRQLPASAKSTFRRYLRQQGLGVLSVRNNTHRDKADRQQPFRLRVPGGVQTAPGSGTLYDIVHFQAVQGDQVRGIGGTVIAHTRPPRGAALPARHCCHQPEPAEPRRPGRAARRSSPTVRRRCSSLPDARSVGRPPPPTAPRWCASASG